MTDPTADAAKLLPSINDVVLKECPFCGNRDEPPNRHALIPQEEKNGGAFCCTACWAEGPFVEPCDWMRAAEAWNTRPQPARPEGEPDWPKLINEWEHKYWYAPALFVPFDTKLNFMLREAYRLGLAAQPKVEDAAEVDLQRVKDISRLTIERDEAREKLAEREAELAIMTGRANDNLDRALAAEQKLADAARQQTVKENGE